MNVFGYMTWSYRVSNFHTIINNTVFSYLNKIITEKFLLKMVYVYTNIIDIKCRVYERFYEYGFI